MPDGSKIGDRIRHYRISMVGLKSISAGAGFAHFDRRTVGSFKLTAGCGMKNGKSHVRNCDSNRVESK